MFLYNRGWRTSISGISPHGVVIHPSHLLEQFISRRPLPTTSILLFDPQLYLLGLSKDDCTEAYINLATYPWFNDTPPSYDSGQFGVRDFKKTLSLSNCGELSYPSDDAHRLQRVKAALNFQDGIGATYLIIPTPLVTNREDQFSEQLRWIDAGLSIQDLYTKPLFASIALSDQCLNHLNLAQNQMLQTIMDTLPTYGTLQGYYIVVERTADKKHLTDFNTARTLLELSYILSEGGVKPVIVNFADVFGAVCLAAGASHFASGYTLKEKRLRFADFEPGFGYPYPHAFVRTLVGDFYSERELNSMPTRRLVRWLESDETTHIKDLILAFKDGKAADSVPDWEERQNNITAATKHRIDSLVSLADTINGIRPLSRRVSFVTEWLEHAEEKMALVLRSSPPNTFTEIGDHLSVWLRALEQFQDETL